MIVLSFAAEIEWHEGHSIARALSRLGHPVRIVNTSAEGRPGYPADAHLTDVLAGDVPDLFVHIEPRGLLPLGLERAPCRTVCVLCDTAIALAPRQDLAQLFDDVVLYHLDAMTAFPAHGPQHVHWSPFALDPDWFRDPGEPRDLDVAYVGSLDGLWQGRRRLVERLAKEWRMNDVERRLTNDEMAALYGRARIVVNTCIGQTINPRVFEAMGSGALLLNGDTPPTLEKMFTPGVHLATFTDIEDAAQRVRYFLAHDRERTAIARAGCEEVRARHTWDLRWQSLLARLDTGPGEAPARRMSAEDVEDIYHRRYKQAGHAEALLRRAAIYPAWSRRRVLTLWRAAATAASVFRRASFA